MAETADVAELRVAAANVANGFFSDSLHAFVANDIVPLVGGGTGDKRHHGIRIAQVEDFVRHVRFDVDEVSSLIFQHVFESGSEFVADASFQDVEDQLEANVDMGVGDPFPLLSIPPATGSCSRGARGKTPPRRAGSALLAIGFTSCFPGFLIHQTLLACSLRVKA